MQSLISTLITTILGMVTSYVGIMQVLNGEMTLGGYMAFSTLSSYFTSPVSELVSLQMSIQQAQISIKRLTEIMDYESEQDETREYTEMEKIDGDIEFKDVSFRYGSRSPALSHVSFTIPYGKKVALVGSSGSGKSTITKLLLKYYEPESGTISVSGVDLDEYSNASVRRAIAYVPQNVELFSKTSTTTSAFPDRKPASMRSRPLPRRQMPTSSSASCRCSTTPIWKKPATASQAVRSSALHWPAPS